MRTSTNHFDINDAADALPTLAQHLDTFFAEEPPSKHFYLLNH